jgi:hypothetical protein
MDAPRRWFPKLRLVLALAIFVPPLAFFGRACWSDAGLPASVGLGVGAAVGVFFGLEFGGALPDRLAEVLYGPKERGADDE